MAYAQLEPFGNDQTLSDAHFANLMALLSNINRAKKGKHYKSDDFMLLKVQEPEEELADGEIYQRFKANLGL